jgi:hypothetical protein
MVLSHYSPFLLILGLHLVVALDSLGISGRRVVLGATAAALATRRTRLVGLGLGLGLGGGAVVTVATRPGRGLLARLDKDVRHTAAAGTLAALVLR